MPAPPRPTPPAHARSPRRPAATALAVGLVALVLAFNPAATRPARAYPGSAVTLVGHGWGHGRGMGQYGALGYAQHGFGYRDILGCGAVGSRCDVAFHQRLVDGRDLIPGRALAPRAPRSTNTANGRRGAPSLPAVTTLSALDTSAATVLALRNFSP